MSQHNKYAFGAIGFVLGVGLALVFLVWSFPGFRNPTYQQDRLYNAKNIETGEDNPVIRPSFWEVYTSPTDTYAQWIMAILSIVATGVSVWAVWLVRNTLEETRAATKAAIDASDSAREALGAERAWILMLGQSIYHGKNAIHNDVVYDELIGFALRFQNFGRTPAINVKSVCTMRIVDERHTIPTVEFPPFGNDHDGSTVGPNAIFSTSSVWTDRSTVDAIKRHEKFLYIFSMIEYEDTFNRTTNRVTNCCFSGEVEDHVREDGGLDEKLILSPRGVAKNTAN